MLSEKLRQIMTENAKRGLTVGRVGELVGSGKTALHRFVGGRSGASVETIDRIGLLLGLKLTVDRKKVNRLIAGLQPPGRPPKNKRRTNQRRKGRNYG